MARHNEVGKAGENMAAIWLKEHGYEILHRNWRWDHYEIDIIAIKGDVLSIIEVKTRMESEFGNPEDSVTKSKFRMLKSAAMRYLHQHPGYSWIQFDILAITILHNGEIEYFLLEDVYL